MRHRLVVIAACLSSACAPMSVTRTSVPLTSRTVVLDERPLPDRDQFTVAGQRQGDALLLTIGRRRLCSTRTAEETVERRTVEREPSTAVIVTELTLAALAAATAYALSRDPDVAGARPVGIASGALSVGLATAAVVDIASAETKESTAVLREQPVEALTPCHDDGFMGTAVRVEAEGLRITGVLDQRGQARLKLPVSFLQEHGDDVSFEVYVADELAGLVAYQGKDGDSARFQVELHASVRRERGEIGYELAGPIMMRVSDCMPIQTTVEGTAVAAGGMAMSGTFMMSDRYAYESGGEE